MRGSASISSWMEHPGGRSIAPAGGAEPAITLLAEARERAIHMLSDAYAYDALTEDEFEWRIRQLGQATTPAAIEALVYDLVAPGTPALPAIDDAPGEQRIVAIMSNERREGRWLVPRRLRLVAVMSEIRLDLRHAIIPDGCTIEVTAVMANVSFIVPPDMPVDFQVSAVLGQTRSDAEHSPYGMPRVRILGGAFLAEVRARLKAMTR